MMSLFFKKFIVWFQEAALIRNVEHALAYSGIKSYRYSRRVITVTFFTVAWLAFSFPVQAQAQEQGELNSAILGDSQYSEMVANAQSITISESKSVTATRDGFTITAAPTKASSASRKTVSPDELSAVQSYASSLVGGGEEFECLYNLWAKESGWRWNAENSNSGAYGIPQALPGTKMSSAGADWQSNPETQVRWGLGYINGRYGSPCSAWQHSVDVGWY